MKDNQNFKLQFIFTFLYHLLRVFKFSDDLNVIFSLGGGGGGDWGAQVF